MESSGSLEGLESSGSLGGLEEVISGGVGEAQRQKHHVEAKSRFRRNADH